VPGWHEATQELQRKGKIRVAGIIEEQHPERARIFMQWKRMDWPLLVDSLNLLGVPAVPITLAIDEQGIIRAVNPPLDEASQFLKEFLQQTHAVPGASRPLRSDRPDFERLRPLAASATAASWRSYADSLFLWGGQDRIGEAIEAYQRSLELAPEDAPTHFRLGVAYRKRYDSGRRQPDDFQSAISNWSTALGLDPNQYIWRRRIEQYGPRLSKPYSFYDWINTAREDIRGRGETPVSLDVEPAGAEFAAPVKNFAAAATPAREADPRGRILRDQEDFIRVEITAVPASIAPGSSARFHIAFRPNLQKKAHWNNEVGNLVLWISPPERWLPESRYFTISNPPQPVSQEVRLMELEVKSPEGAQPGFVTIPGYALYYVCEDVNGTCLYRRQDIKLKIKVR
jgi:tetratricopeptide (TPR) repeat protein